MDTSVSKSSDRLSYQLTMLVSFPSIQLSVPVSFWVGRLLVLAVHMHVNVNCLYCNFHLFLFTSSIFTRPQNPAQLAKLLWAMIRA